MKNEYAQRIDLGPVALGSRDGGRQYNCEDAQQVTELEQLDKKLTAALAELHEIAARTRMLGDRLLGQRPEAVASKGQEPSANSQISKLNQTADYLLASLEYLRDSVGWLQRL